MTNGRDITIYTKLYGDGVSGLVYVDPSHPDQWDEAALGKSLEASMLMKIAKIAQGLSWTGIVRLYVAVLVSDAPNAPREALKISSIFASKSLGPILSKWDTKESFGNLFRDTCNAAGVKERAHGVRKIGASRVAHEGATVAELEAIFGPSGRRHGFALHPRGGSSALGQGRHVQARWNDWRTHYSRTVLHLGGSLD
jgi:hypothetical protein